MDLTNAVFVYMRLEARTHADTRLVYPRDITSPSPLTMPPKKRSAKPRESSTRKKAAVAAAMGTCSLQRAQSDKKQLWNVSCAQMLRHR